MTRLSAALLLPGVLIWSLATGQGSPYTSSGSFQDSLSLSLWLAGSGGRNAAAAANEPEPVERKYDFEYQYPYYSLRLKDWPAGESLQLLFRKFPRHGYLYVLTEDGSNNFKVLPPYEIDSSQHKPLVMPDPQKALVLGKLHTIRICILYSTDQIPDFEKLVNVITMTYGNFLFRINGRLAGQLLLPSLGWHLLNKEPGFAMDRKSFPLPQKFILPILIQVKSDDSENQ
jgi:hypothetical protein